MKPLQQYHKSVLCKWYEFLDQQHLNLLKAKINVSFVIHMNKYFLKLISEYLAVYNVNRKVLGLKASTVLQSIAPDQNR